MTDPLFHVEDQIVLVTGGSRGIGKAIAQGFADRNAQVIIAGREKSTLQATADEISQSSANGKRTKTVTPIVCDVSEEDDVTRLVEQVISEFGQVDTLLNVAGVNRRQRVETYTMEDYDFVVNINLRGAFMVSHQVGQHQIQRGKGCQINIDSLNTYAPLKGVTPYAISKGGLNMMTRCLALEWGEYGIRVNGLAPGFILTDLTTKLWSEPKMQAWSKENTPQQRLGQPEDMVGTAIFLASPAAEFLTGQTIYVDGGFCSGVSWPIDL